MTLRVINGGTDAQLGVAEYVWLTPGGDTRSQLLVVPVFVGDEGPVPEVKPLVTDEIVYHPCNYMPDPFQPQPAFLVLCETRRRDGKVVPWNYRAKLREDVEREGGRRLADWVFEQRFDRVDDAWKAMQDYFLRCIDAGIMIQSGCFDLDMPYWVVKIGRRPGGVDSPLGQNFTLEACDHLVLARHLLKKTGAEHRVKLTLTYPNSAHFSTVEMREDPELAKPVAEALSLPRIREGYVEYPELGTWYDPYRLASKMLGVVLKEPV